MFIRHGNSLKIEYFHSNLDSMVLGSVSRYAARGQKEISALSHGKRSYTNRRNESDSSKICKPLIMPNAHFSPAYELYSFCNRFVFSRRTTISFCPSPIHASTCSICQGIKQKRNSNTNCCKPSNRPMALVWCKTTTIKHVVRPLTFTCDNGK